MTKHGSVPAKLWLIGVALSLALVTDQGLAEQREPRFALVYGGAAVKDSQTGLIWEQEPDREHDVWSRSNERCVTKTVGGQSGWRGPTIEELKTLIDPSQHDPALPAGHPFSNIKSEIYWTSTPHPTDDIVAWQVSFFSGEPVTDQKSGTRRMWCVLAQTKK
jgi:Protein of unknown function (DUF1566)